MTDFEKELKKYRKEIRRLLLVKTKASAGFLSELENNIMDYAEANQIGDIEKIKARFGSPEDVARAFFAETEIGTVRKRLTLRNAVVAALLAALLLWGAAVTALYVEGRSDMHGSFSEEIVVTEGDAL